VDISALQKLNGAISALDEQIGIVSIKKPANVDFLASLRENRNDLLSFLGDLGLARVARTRVRVPRALGQETISPEMQQRFRRWVARYSWIHRGRPEGEAYIDWELAALLSSLWFLHPYSLTVEIRDLMAECWLLASQGLEPAESIWLAAREDAIRVLAYRQWEAEGRPEGRSAIHTVEAASTFEQQVLTRARDLPGDSFAAYYAAEHSVALEYAPFA